MAAKSQKDNEIVKDESITAVEEQQEESKELAIADTTELSAGDVEYDDDDYGDLGFTDDELVELNGLDNINADKDIRVPYVKLHAKDSIGFEKGDIQLLDGTKLKGKDGEVLEDLCMLKFQWTRVYFPEKFNKDNTFICRSLDGIEGAPDGEYAGRKCAECPFSKFGEDGTPPPCREQALTTNTLPTGEMFNILVSGISVTPFRDVFLSNEMMKGMNAAKRKNAPEVLAVLNLVLSAKIEETPNGAFPKFYFRVNKKKPIVGRQRLDENLAMYKRYKTFDEIKSLASAATFAQYEQGEHEADGPAGENDKMF